MINDLTKLFTRDLDILSAEVQAYTNEDNLWKVAGNISNSGGNLALHLCGNLKHFIGARMGNTGYVRERDKEFSTTGATKEELLQNILETKMVVIDTLNNLDLGDLDKEFEIPSFKEEITLGYWLLHLSTHLNYHLGQINYHRRLIDLKEKI